MNVRFNAISELVHVGRALLMWLPIGMFFALGFEHGSLVRVTVGFTKNLAF